ncbi:MAG: hypothetical protein SFW67_08545 [Myxococcaceae bacterium]|nr:hypothetical protein [Myxococcaceae bacterium]
MLGDVSLCCLAYSLRGLPGAVDEPAGTATGGAPGLRGASAAGGLSNNGTDNLELGLGLQGGGANVVPGSGGAINFPVSQTFARGQWHRVELFLQVNTPGIADGIYRAWVNGIQIANHTNVPYYAAGQTADRGLHWINPTSGGGLASVPADQFFLLDDWHVSLSI